MRPFLKPTLSFVAAVLCLVAGPESRAAASETDEASTRLMVVTVDDLPVAPPGAHTTEEQVEITQRLLDTLAKHRVPAIGFVNESKLEVEGEIDPRRVALLERWLDAGLALGNHGHGHLDLHRVEPARWEADILKGERVLRPLLTARDLELGFFRHPFLHTGRSLEVKRRTEAFLAQLGYRVAPVTIDNQEWLFGRAYVDAGDDADERHRIGEAYLDYMEAVIAFYEEQSVAIVGEEIPQTLLVHAYELNADWLDALLERISARGYLYITLEKALEHPAYRSEDEFVGPQGITWLHRWALTRGMPASTFAGEPEVPEWIAPNNGR